MNESWTSAYGPARVMLLVLCLIVSSPSLAQADQSDTQILSGPSSVPGQMDEDQKAHERAEREARLKERKDRLRKRYGLTLGGDYNALYQALSDSDGENDAASGVIRLYGTWTPVREEGKPSGTLVFKVENRHRLGTTIPNQVLLPINGVAGISGATYSDAGTLLTNFYWTQAFFDNKFAFNLGVVDVTDYTDIFGLVNVWTDFNNQQFSTSLTSPLPNQSLGGVVRYMFTPNYYLLAGMADANGDPHHPEDYFDSFGDHEYFKHVEFGWIQSWNQRYTDKVHVLYWQQDERTAVGIPSGEGATLSVSRTLNDRWQGFVRGGYADGGGTLLARFASVGAGYSIQGGNNYLGFGAGWGRAPGEDGKGAGSRDQYTFEAYYRWQPDPALQITPGIQLILDPALDPNRNSMFVAGLRMRLSF